MTRDDILKVLQSHRNIISPKVIERNNGYDRNMTFTIKGNQYRIEWWANIRYLFIAGGGQLPFDSVEVSSTWSNHYKCNLQFFNRDNTVAFILPIESHTCDQCDSESLEGSRLCGLHTPLGETMSDLKEMILKQT